MPDSDRPAAALVGARNCTHYGERMALEYGEKLAENGISIISGWQEELMAPDKEVH